VLKNHDTEKQFYDKFVNKNMLIIKNIRITYEISAMHIG